ncbi:predicted protein [Naegleria gruberi]|uniref:Protein phosphatase n=1 Tax=Naegleria gruberi TaxID=5762 RepID=D2VGQ6_NAEGR|nr:uncharacterized protein NAEGRDRAFT_68061 [Naegleria gruberi]EFC44009.1 predicted protein [Naegleria gruberi]|eukprot:XP_002676753.1 predicted protein [Naegleria gruberi strain NEG-M]
MIDESSSTITSSLSDSKEDANGLISCSCSSKTTRYRFLASVYGFSKIQYYDYSDLSKLREDELNLGEDFYFYTNYYLGVSDGVGGWSSYGVDSSKVSRDIMNNCKYYASEEEKCLINSHNGTVLKPNEILTMAYDKELEYYNQLNIDKPLGSTTACVLHLDSLTCSLSYTNIGDSGFMILRKSEIENQQQTLFVAKDRSRIINGLGKAPYQLSFLPPRMIETKEYFHDSPSDAVTETNIITLKEEDIIIMGSDGLFDNIKTDYVAEYVNEIFPNGSIDDVPKLARELAEIARNQHRKIDDIVCLCAKVVKH